MSNEMTNVAALDITELVAIEDTILIELLDPADSPLFGPDGERVTITVYGPGSKEYQRANAAQQNRMLDKLKRKGKSDQTAEERSREQAEFLTGCTKSFSPNLRMGELQGEHLYRAVYSNPKCGWIVDQVSKSLGDWGNFTKRSTAN